MNTIINILIFIIECFEWFLNGLSFLIDLIAAIIVIIVQDVSHGCSEFYNTIVSMLKSLVNLSNNTVEVETISKEVKPKVTTRSSGKQIPNLISKTMVYQPYLKLRAQGLHGTGSFDNIVDLLYNIIMLILFGIATIGIFMVEVMLFCIKFCIYDFVSYVIMHNIFLGFGIGYTARKISLKDLPLDPDDKKMVLLLFLVCFDICVMVNYVLYVYF